MPDPITVTMLGAAFTESIRFLYGQASDLLKARRERRAAGSDEQIVSELPASTPIEPHPATLIADSAALDARSDELAELATRLAPVAEGWRDPDPETELVAGELREILEAVYGQRLTFAGEDREATGTTITVRQEVDHVGPSGRLVGAETSGSGSDSHVTTKIGTLEGVSIGVRHRR